MFELDLASGRLLTIAAGFAELLRLNPGATPDVSRRRLGKETIVQLADCCGMRGRFGASAGQLDNWIMVSSSRTSR